MNAFAAIAAARHAGVPLETSLAALAGFRGVKRRLERIGAVPGVNVYDDFAHHPTAFAPTVASLRRVVGAQRIVAVLELRSNTMKLGTMNAAAGCADDHRQLARRLLRDTPRRLFRPVRC